MKTGNKNSNIFPVLIIAVSLLIFLFVALEINTGNTKNFDDSILLFFREANNLNVPIASGWLLPFMKTVTLLGNLIPIIIVTLLMLIILLIKKETRFLWIVLMAVIGGGLIDLILKDLFARSRPEIVPHLVYVSSFSFPSGHSVMSAVIFPALAAIIIRVTGNKYLKLYITATIIMVLLVGFSRIYLGVHYPTDVIAGWFTGIAWSSLCWIISGMLKIKNT